MRVNVFCACLCAIACVVVGALAGHASRDLEHLEVKSLTVRHPGSKYRVDLLGQKDMAGLFVVGPTAPRGIVACCDEQGAYVGLRDARSDGTCDLALAVPPQGDPYVQLVVDGRVTMLDADELRAIARDRH